MKPDKILYTAHSTATGGRDGRATSSDQVLDVALATPRELGGAGGAGTNPEQLFGAGYSACFLSAIKFVAGKSKIALPADSKVSANVGIGVPTWSELPPPPGEVSSSNAPPTTASTSRITPNESPRFARFAIR